jgi:alanine transaminase
VAAEGRKIIYTNIGNPHAVGQKPITYYRQVLALCDLPDEYGVKNPQIVSAFPSDVIERAMEMREAIGPGGTGAYTNSQGIGKFRDDVAHFITARDGHVSFPSNIFLTNGASAAIESVLTGLIGNNRDAIMIPIPQYVSCDIAFMMNIFNQDQFTHNLIPRQPIYSAIISRLGARQVGYFLGKQSPYQVAHIMDYSLISFILVSRRRKRVGYN